MKLKIILLLATGLVGIAPTAQAQMAVACVNCETAMGAQSTGMQIVNAINQAKDRIVGAIQGASTAQSAATSESAKVVADANTKTAAEMKKLDIELKMEPLDPCGVTAVAKGGSEASNSRPGGSGRGGSGGSGGSSTPTAGGTSSMVESLRIANGEKPSPSPEVAAALAVNGACGTFAKGKMREASCSAAGYSTGLTSGLPNADIKAETIFDGPQTTSEVASGNVVRKLTISPQSPQRTAINAFIRNLETPVDLRTLAGSELKSEAGRNYLALRDTYDAVMSLATKPLRDQEALIMANKETIPILNQLMKSADAKYVSDHLAKTFPSWRTEGISYAHLMNLEASRRYLNEGWHARMAGANESQLLAEQVQMQAFKGWTDTLMLERQQQIAILQGTVAGSVLRTEKMPMLVAAHKAAKR